MEFKKVFALFAVILAVSGMAMAIRGVTEMTDPTFLDRWEGMTATGNVTTEGGNISWQNMNGSSLTDRWAGFYGDVTAATIYLTDNVTGTTDYLYHWVASGSESGEICVSTDSAYDFSLATAAAATDVNTAWGFGGVADNATETYTGQLCNLTFEEQSVYITNTANATHEGQSTFNTCVINNSAATANNYGALAFCVAIDSTPGTIYNGSSAEYELLVPANDSDSATTQYFFYIEID